MKRQLKVLLPLFAVLTASSMVVADDRDYRRDHPTGHAKPGQSVERLARPPRGAPVSHYYRPGYRVDRLPDRHYHFVHSNRDYYYFGGNFFYRPHGYYEVIRAPYGARVPYLPPGYVSFYVGPSRYFYVNFTYYLWDERDRAYIVVKEPDGGGDAVATAAPQSSSEIYAYPAQGQSAKQQDRDYYDCHVWAVDESGYDPTLEGQNVYKSRDYRRAMIACLEGRGYSVR